MGCCAAKNCTINITMTDLVKAICGNETLTIGSEPSTWAPVLNNRNNGDIQNSAGEETS